MDLAPGTILLGKYRIDALIGSGGMGNVVRASHLYLHQSFAIKVLLPQMTESDSTKQRFLREAQATVKLKSEHSARVMDVGVLPEGTPYMVMEFLDGNDLNQILRHHGPQLPGIVVDLMLQACEGISEAHALGIVHRDIKPSNFFITRRPDGSMLLKILDFGISKTPVGIEELTATQTVIGTPSYMAPEQMKSGRSADPRSDIWSLGVVMYQLLTGRTPFDGESYAELVLKVGLEPPLPILVPLPPGLGDIILRCLEKDPAARFQNVGELARVLAPYATDPIASSQAANRALRILQQRGLQAAMQLSPLVTGGGLPTPIPISPAQLTPRSWPPSQGTSSHGAGQQVTQRTRSGRGLLIAGVASLCVLAGVGGYAVSQMSRTSPTGESHVEPAAAPSTLEAPMPTAPPQPKAASPAPEPKAASPSPSAASPSPEPKAAAAPPEPKAANPSPSAARPAPEPKASAAPPEPKASAVPSAQKPAPQAPEPKSSTHANDAKSSTHATDAKSSSKPKPSKPKPSDDLFDSRH